MVKNLGHYIPKVKIELTMNCNMIQKKKSSRNLTKKMRFIDFLSGTVCESSDDEDGCDKYGPSGIALS